MRSNTWLNSTSNKVLAWIKINLLNFCSLVYFPEIFEKTMKTSDYIASIYRKINRGSLKPEMDNYCKAHKIAYINLKKTSNASYYT